jgi:hypothetical membrane protein
MKQIMRPAIIAATIGPVQSVLGWVIAGALMPDYDPIRRTISDLAADDSPVKWIQSSFFILGGTLTLLAAIYARSLAMPGRVALFAAGIATYGLTIFATPSQIGYSNAHRAFAIASFILMSAWPLLSMRFDKSYPWVLRPFGAIGATLVLTVISLWFLATWTDPNGTITGLSERIIAVSQTVWLSAVIWICWLAGRKKSTAGRIN